MSLNFTQMSLVLVLENIMILVLSTFTCDRFANHWFKVSMQ